jgi:helicase
MKVDKLIRYGIPQSVIENWRKIQGEVLLPLQAAAVTKYDLLEGQSLIICAPTSSGKTFCGEMAAVANLFKRKKVVFLVPLKAIAEEKFSDFSEKYGRLGIKVVVSTRDRQEQDREIEKGNFDLAIMIYEKFNQLLIKNLDILSLINLIVVDELQMIADPTRGPVLELALTKIISSVYSPQILGLSAVLKDAQRLSSWLGSQFLFHKSRPVELLQGVLLNGTFHYRKYNSGEEGTSPLVELDSDESHQILFANMEKLLRDGEQVLVFLKSKKNCEDCAFLFSERIDLPSCSGAIEALSQLENTTLKEGLLLVLQKGISFHNADMTFDERRIVETFYLKGEIKAIFSTTTLALGINLPAKTVFIETQKFEPGEYSGKAVMLPIRWSEYENMSGRAGRFGLEKEFGRSLIIAQNKFQFDSLWEGYIEGEEEEITSQLHKKKLGDVILDLVASGSGKTLAKLNKVKRCCLHGKLDQEEQKVLEEEVGKLIKEEIIQKSGEILSPSRLGQVCAFKGISISTCLSIKKKLEASLYLDSFSWLYSILNTKDGKDTYINMGFWEQQNRVYERALKERYKGNITTDEAIMVLLDKSIGFSPGESRLLKLCFLLSEWITPESTLYLEGRYFCRSGQIEQIGKRASWLLDSACGIAKIMNKDRRLVHFLKRLSLMVNFGVNEDGLKLARLRVPGLGRDYIWSLVNGGFASPRRIKQAKIEELERLIPCQAAQSIKKRIEQGPKKHNSRVTPDLKNKRTRGDTPILLLDGTPVRDRFLVMVNGKKVALPAKSFKYLVKLVWAAHKNEDGWIHKNDFEPGENQTRYLHRLKKQITPYLDPAQSLLENNRLGSYRLGVSKDKIRINAPTLLKNPDIEIMKMAEELAGWRNGYEKHDELSSG